MKKWEYKSDIDLTTKDLNFYGKQGWELVCTMIDSHDPEMWLFYFKRPLQDEEPTEMD